MEGIERASEPADWHEKIDWSASDYDIKEQIALLYSQTCEDFKNRPNFKGIFHRLTGEFAAAHPGVEGDKLYASWMITRMRKEFLGKA